MKRTVIAIGSLALAAFGNNANADTSGSGHSVDVIPGDWDDDDTKLNFNFKDIPAASFSGLRLSLSCGLPGAKILYTTDANVSKDNAGAWTEYTEPLTLTEDCTVRFFARAEGYNDSDIQSYTFVYADHQTAIPVIAPDMERNHIIMTCSTEGAAIRYTTDGSEPTSESALYEGPVAIEANCTFRARAFADELFDSSVTQYAVDFLTVEIPSVAFENKALVIHAGTEGDEVYYTTDPEASADNAEAWIRYTAPVALTEDCTVRYMGRRGGYHDSAIGTFSFVYTAYQVSAPLLSADEEGTHVVMSCDTPDAEIRYTTDGSEPTAESEPYRGPVEITGNGTFRARAFAEGLFDSNTVEYIVMHLAVPDPTAAFEDLKMALGCADGKASIYYTLDAEASPADTEAWTLYTAPISLTEDCLLRFFARRDNFNDSDIESVAFVYAAYQAPAPSLSRNAQGTHVVMASQTAGGQIRYTADGSEPTAESALYEAPVRIQDGATYRARVFADNMFDSEISEYAIGNDKLKVPTATYDHFTLVLSTDQEGVQIWYTTDPELSVDNADAWSLYESPLALGDDCTYRFFAGDDDANASDVQSFVFQKADWQAAAPLIERTEDGRSVWMSTATEGAEIRYTTDGSEPTEDSALYTEPVFLTQNCTFRARAFADGLYDSAETEFTVANLMMMMPHADFENLRLSLSVWDEGATIWYTTNPDALPEEESAWIQYTEPIALDSDCTVRFFSRRGGFLDSQIATYDFVYADWQTAAPAIRYSAETQTIAVECLTEGAEIRYTLDGSEPTEESALYSGPMELAGNFTFRARAFAEGLFDSVTSDFAVEGVAVASAGANFEGLRLNLFCPDLDAQVLYTFDADATPDNAEAWTLYTEPLALTEDCTVRFFARRANFDDSFISRFDFVYADWQTAAPALEYDAASQEVSISCSTDGAEIRYTTDGSEPTAESELYTGPIAVSGSVTVKARAYADGLFESVTTKIEVSGTSGVAGILSEGSSFRIERSEFGIVVIADEGGILPIYRPDGIMVRTVEIIPGINAIEGLERGTYILAGKKVRF